ncbi:hypothetical protein NADRNF5_0466 [Nitrosopumilus adriaticus]|uniref:Uncharacterized protein n=1 Tax=Nitrosopumilus adriaticus TaxID=1580092 RepID=A0A0D5C170_9ARCH|nr:hypothetical protein NADRNF5_0466 [Nitrosopumilus adriaticus]
MNHSKICQSYGYLGRGCEIYLTIDWIRVNFFRHQKERIIEKFIECNKFIKKLCQIYRKNIFFQTFGCNS